MKKMKYFGLFCLAALASASFTACNDEDDYFDSKNQSKEIVISKIYLEDYESSVPDREVTFARLGQLIRIEGSGLYGMKQVIVNGYDTYFNRAYVADNSMLLTLSSNTPITDAEESERNVIKFIKDNTSTSYSFEIRAAAPSVTSISNTLPQAGETVIVYGTNLHETTLVTLPGDIEITDIENDVDGAWYSFVMPEGVTESGSIVSTGANGGAKTASCFNFDSCMIIDFEDLSDMGGWSATYTSDDLATDPLSSGRGTVVPFIPQSVVDEGGLNANGGQKGWFTAGNDSDNDDWSRMYSYIPAETSVSEIALQFDIYCPEPWSTGVLEFTFQNNLSSYGYGSTETTNTTNITYPTAVVWVPWLQSDGSVVPYQTEGWQTVTIPVSNVGKFKDTDSGYTLQNVVEDRNAGSYRNFGMFFVNDDIEFSDDLTISASKFCQMIYVDNWRIVPNETFTVSDFDDEEE